MAIGASLFCCIGLYILFGYSLIFHAREKNDIQDMDIGIPYSTSEIVVCVDLLTGNQTDCLLFFSLVFFFFLLKKE